MIVKAKEGIGELEDTIKSGDGRRWMKRYRRLARSLMRFRTSHESYCKPVWSEEVDDRIFSKRGFNYE
jgi:hypothetical protein